ncbi:MAG: HAMP domain-containing sensor histidine kinase [Acidimicrobiales bacterium]
MRFMAARHRSFPGAHRLKGYTMIGLLIASPLVAYGILIDERSSEAAVLQQQQDLAELDDLMGYGGLIHNFKNWVLRPGEPRYRDDATRQANEAIAVLNRLDHHLNGETIEMDDAFATIREYQTNIDRVTELHQQGWDIEAIDAEVRVDDAAALATIDALQALISASIVERRAHLRQEQQMFWLLVVSTATSIALLDYSRRRASNTRLLEAARHTSDMESFTRIAAHDLKAPLNQISSLVDFIREDVGEAELSPELEHHLTRIDERIVRLNARIVGVFEYLRAGDSNEPMVSVDLRQLIDDVSAALLADDVQVVIDPSVGVVTGRPAELETVVGNLLSNAVKHHPDHSPAIKIKLENDDHGPVLHVIDDGPGFTLDRRQSVFEMYSTLDQLADPLSGVGLAMVRRIVNSWGGEITIADVVPHGADVMVRLPAN